MIPSKEKIERCETRGHALWQRTTYDSVVISHILENDAYVSDCSPLYCDSRETVLSTMFDYPLHGRVRPAVVSLSGIPSSRRDRRESNEPKKVCTAPTTQKPILHIFAFTQKTKKGEVLNDLTDVFQDDIFHSYLTQPLSLTLRLKCNR